MDMMDQSPSPFNQDINHRMDGTGVMGEVGGGMGVKREGGGKLEVLYNYN